MDHDIALKHIAEQAAAFRAAAVAAGPAAAVPTCSKWTVSDLVAHLARVYGYVGESLLLPPDAEGPAFPTAPTEWDELLPWWDDNLATILTRLNTDPAQPAWGFIPNSGTVGWWARRQAHETAIHRLDAEHALHGDVPTLIFNSELAADGIDEVLATLSPVRAAAKHPEVTVEGTLLVHAADAGRAWLVHAHGGTLDVGPANVVTDTDASLVGTADAVYRAVWKRPSTAVLSGRAELLDAVNGG